MDLHFCNQKGYQPLITIVTSTLNCVDALRLTAKSVGSQKSCKFEWIVIDGGSTDGTLDIIHEYKSSITYSISEHDDGIYYAWNKACKHIRGEWVIFLGAGDVFASDEVLSKISKTLETLNEEVTFAYGNVIDGRQNPKIHNCRINDDEWDLYRPKLPCHQGVFQRSNFLKSGDPFDTSYKIVADSKFIIKIKNAGTQTYIPYDVTVMAPGGVSQCPGAALQTWKEFLRLEKDLGYRIPWTNKAIYSLRVFVKHTFFLLGLIK